MYIVVGKFENGKTAYWNNGWYVCEEDAKKYKTVDEADSASINAEEALTMEDVSDIRFIKK